MVSGIFWVLFLGCYNSLVGGRLPAIFPGDKFKNAMGEVAMFNFVSGSATDRLQPVITVCTCRNLSYYCFCCGSDVCWSVSFSPKRD